MPLSNTFNSESAQGVASYYYSESAMHDFLEKSPTLSIYIDEPIKGDFTSYTVTLEARRFRVFLERLPFISR